MTNKKKYFSNNNIDQLDIHSGTNRFFQISSFWVLKLLCSDIINFGWSLSQVLLNPGRFGSHVYESKMKNKNLYLEILLNNLYKRKKTNQHPRRHMDQIQFSIKLFLRFTHQDKYLGSPTNSIMLFDIQYLLIVKLYCVFKIIKNISSCKFFLYFVNVVSKKINHKL